MPIEQVQPTDPSTGAVVPGVSNTAGAALPNRRTHVSGALVIHQSTGRHEFYQEVRTHVSQVGQPQAGGHWTHQGVNEIQLVTITGSPTGGTFTLTFEGNTTTALAYNATAYAIQQALYTLPTLHTSTTYAVPGDVEIQGDFPEWRVEFLGTRGQQPVPPITATSSLTGGTSPAVVMTTLQEGSELQSTLAPTIGSFDDHVFTRRSEAEAVIAGLAGDENNAALLARTGSVTVPVGPVGGTVEGTAKIWRGHVFSGRVAWPAD